MITVSSAARVAGALGALGATVVPSSVLAKSTPSRPTVRKVQVVDNMYLPGRLSIRSGAEVDFVWSDENFNTHNVHLVVAPKGVVKKRFDSRDGSRDMHFERRFTVPGTYEFTCTIHTEMMFRLTVRR